MSGWIAGALLCITALVERVDVSVAGQEGDAAAMEAILFEQLEEVAVDLHARRVDAIDPAEVVDPDPDAPAVVARVWIDLRDSSRATVYIADGPWERVLVRHVPLRNGIDEVAREEIGHIVAMSVEALADGATIGITREQAEIELGVAQPRPASAPTVAEAAPAIRPRPRRLALVLSASWQPRWWAPGVPLHGPGLAAEILAARPRVRPGGAIEGRYELPWSRDDPRLDLRVHTGSLRAFATLRPAIAPRLSVDARLGGGVDILRVEPFAGGASVDLNRPFWDLVPIAAADLALVVDLWRVLALEVRTGIDVDLTDTRFVLWQSNEVVLDPWRVRPRVAFALAWDVLGGGR